MSHPLAMMLAMRLANDVFGCEHCGREFERRFRRGRHPHYCSRTCRQRAYEARRRGAYVLGLPQAPLPRPSVSRTYRPAYETGLRYPLRHALRPDGAPDARNLRPTLCGTRAATSPAPFEPWFGRAHIGRPCRICVRLARRFPVATPPSAAADLARARHLVGRLRGAISSRASDAEVREAATAMLAQFEVAVPSQWEYPPPLPPVVERHPEPGWEVTPGTLGSGRVLSTA